MREYKLTYDEETINEAATDDTAIAWQRVGVEVVFEHFALRTEYVPHQAGEGLVMESWCLDHMSTGRRIHGGGVFNPVSRESCLLLAGAISTAPVDWSVSDVETPVGFKEWFPKAREAANNGDALAWPADGHSSSKEPVGD